MMIYECHIFPPSGPAQGVLQTKACLLRCAHKHKRIEILKTLKTKPACLSGAYKHNFIEKLDPFKPSSLLRCAYKHSVSALKTQEAFRDIPFGVNTLLPASLRVQILLKSLCLLCYAHKHQKMKYKIKNQRQRPLWSEQYSIVLVICCGHSHHECHACYAAHISTKLLILLFY